MLGGSEAEGGHAVPDRGSVGDDEAAGGERQRGSGAGSSGEAGSEGGERVGVGAGGETGHRGRATCISQL